MSAKSLPGIKVLPIGNAGVGKSFLCNAALGRDTFASRVSPTGVTTAVERADLTLWSTKYILYNIPGLIEADATAVERNRRCLAEAFQQDAHLPSLIFFIFSAATGGRPRAEDVESCQAVLRDVDVGKDGSSVCFLVNKLPLEEFDSAEEAEDFKTSFRRDLMAALKDCPAVQGRPVLFAPHVRTPSAKNECGRQVLAAIRQCTPSFVALKETSFRFRREVDVQREELARSKALQESQARQAQLQLQERQRALERERLAREEAQRQEALRAQEQHQRQLEAQRREAERLRREQEETERLAQAERERREAEQRQAQQMFGGHPMLGGHPMFGGQVVLMRTPYGLQLVRMPMFF